jgi:uncharacterized cupin superfamily protein
MPTISDIKVSKPTEEQAKTASAWPIWAKEASEFPWQYTEMEKCLIIEGEVTVYSEDKSQSVSFAAGDYVVFPRGLACIWKIDKDVKKHYDFG